jgi:penicillin-binding protein 1C
VLLYDFYQDQRREPFEIGEVGANLINATIAIEDKDFYKHAGFDYLTIVRIPYYYLTQGRVVGGSTLTQQLTKMMLLTSEKKIIRKFRELILSMQIEKLFTKDKILEMYLNEASYGGNINGVNLAARIYFGKNMSDLTVAEAAVLAGLPQSPTRYSPFTGRFSDDGTPLWKIRARGVLRRMLEDGYVGNGEYEAAVAELETFAFSRNQDYGEIKAPHFVFYVEEELRKMYGDEIVDAGGLVVKTTLDYDLQASSEAIVSREIEKVLNVDITNGAALVLNPQNGEILAMVGSRNFFDTEIDGQFNVTAHPQALRQPGSSIKPLVYLALLEQGATPATLFVDVPTTFQVNELIEPYDPKNYDGKFRGPVTLREALGNSYNIPAVKALAHVGIEEFLNFAYRAGLSTLEPTRTNLSRYGLAMALGGADVRMIEMTGAYASFGNGGYKVEPRAILEVDSVQGQQLFRQQSVRGERIFEEGEVYLINNILSDNGARTAAFGANSQLNTKLPIAVKTGTTNAMRDNWTIGWNSNFLVHVWVGNNDYSPMKNVASGITGASPIWRAIIDHLVVSGYPTPEWEIPASVEKRTVDAISGYPTHDEYPTKEEYFVRNTVGALPDPIHAKMAVCKGQNKLATSAQLVNGESEDKEFIVLREIDPYSEDGRNRFQEAIDTWVAGQGDGRYHYPTEMCGDSQAVSVVIYDLSDKMETSVNYVKFRVRADSGKGVEKVELYLNGVKKEEKSGSDSFDVEWQLDKGIYEIKAKAMSRDGQVVETGVYKVAVGGAKFEEEKKETEATPTPSPTPSPTPEPESP